MNEIKVIYVESGSNVNRATCKSTRGKKRRAFVPLGHVLTNRFHKILWMRIKNKKGKTKKQKNRKKEERERKRSVDKERDNRNARVEQPWKKNESNFIRGFHSSLTPTYFCLSLSI